MFLKRIKSMLAWLNKFFARRFEKITEINRKYRNPRIAMTPMTRILLLRIYLLLLVAILFYKFFTTIVAK
jgi:lysyl-tRNA synthetase class II